MRHVLLVLALLLPLAATAQEPTWLHTDGPGFEIARSASTLLDDRPDILVDAAGQALARLTDGAYVLDSDTDAWSRYTEQRSVLAVIGSDYVVAASNLFSSGSGQNPLNEYLGSAAVYERNGSSEQSVNSLSIDDGWVEHAEISPAGDVWIGIQGYEGLGPVSEPSGTPTGISVAALSNEDLEGSPDDWTVTSVPDAQVLLVLAWATPGLLVGTDNGLFAESGGTWSRLAFENEEVYSVAESTTGALLASVSGPNPGQGRIYRSTDGGATWTEVAPLPERRSDLLATSGAVLGTAGADGVFRSLDDGDTWEMTDMTVSATALAGPRDGPYFAAGYSATLHRSDDGLTWSPVLFSNDGPLSFTPTTEGLVAKMTTDLFRFEQEAWHPIIAPTGRWLPAFNVGPNGVYYLSVVYGQQSEEPGNYLSRLYRSQDAGASWVLASSLVGVPELIEVTDAGTLLVMLSRVELGGGHLVFRSDDGGANWTSTLTTFPGSSLRQSISGTVRVTSGDHFWSSTDDGQTWTEHAFPPGSLTDMLELESGSLVATRTAGVYLATGDGEPWTPSSHTSTVRDIDRNAAGDLFIGASQCGDDTDADICRSMDGGATWEPYSSSSPFTSVQTLAVDGRGVLFVRGPSPAPGQARTYRTLNATVDAEGGPVARADVSAYPNPVVRRAHLRFATAQSGRVTVTVYDALGRVVQTLRDADLGPGTHRLSWDATGVVSGAYFVRVVTPDASRTVPLTVVR